MTASTDFPGQTEVLVADDQPLFRDALTRVVRQSRSFRLVAELDEGRSALSAIRRLMPAVAVLGADLPGLDGQHIARAVARARLPTALLVLVGDPRSERAYETLGAGAAGLLSRVATGAELQDAIGRVARGETVLGVAAQADLAKAIRLRAAHGRPAFSEREHEVLALIAAGKTAPEIARELHLATATVKTHMLHLYGKLDVSERAAAVAQAMRRGLLE